MLFKKKIQRCKFDFVRRLIKSVTALYNLSVSAKDKRLLIYIKTYTFLAGFNRKCNHITSLVKRTIFKNKTLIYWISAWEPLDKADLNKISFFLTFLESQYRSEKAFRINWIRNHSPFCALNTSESCDWGNYLFIHRAKKGTKG